MKSSRIIKLVSVCFMVCFCVICFASEANAKTLTKSNSKTFAFVDTYGSPASATVNCYLSQDYFITYTGLTSYEYRKAEVSFSYVASGSGVIPKLTLYKPKFVDGNSNTVAEFADWKPYDIVYSSSVSVPMHHYSRKIKQYSRNNSYYYMVNYTIGNSDFTLGAFKAGSCKISLKV